LKLNSLKLTAVFITGLFSLSAQAEVHESVIQTRDGKAAKNTFFSSGFKIMKHTLKAGDGNELIGNSNAIQMGYGRIYDKYYHLTSIDFMVGPHEPSADRQLTVDYNGTGITTWWGYSAENKSFQMVDDSYGFAIGLSYYDVVGRSIGKNLKQTDTSADDDKTLIDSYEMRVTNFSLLPGIFFCWLTPPREKGNTPELLKTRIEGYFLTMGFSTPLLSKYSAKKRYRYDDSSTSTESSETMQGQMIGYGVLISLTALFGI
jgi:hypothetical protein